MLIILVIVAIIVSVVIFRNYYKTEQERADHQNRLYIGMGIGILAAFVITYMLSGDDAQEYGGGFSSLFKKKTAKPQTPAYNAPPAAHPWGPPPAYNAPYTTVPPAGTYHANTVIGGRTNVHGDGGRHETFIIE